MNGKYRNFVIALLIVIAAASAFYIYTLSGRKIGLYQHIRKAHEYIEEGKYEKAIYMLHKAYEESPKSENIRDALLRGYVEYGRYLKNEGDLNAAIDYMDMAYEMAPKSSLVINELAFYYAKKAVIESEGKDYVTAIRTLQKATDLAIKSKKIRRNIANLLYNEAVDAYQANDGTTVLLCLNTSYMLWPRFETLDFLGQYYYKDHDLDNALFYWEKALSTRPEDTVMKEKVEGAKKEVAAEGKMRVIEMPHFDIQLYKDYDVDIGILRGILDDIYRQVGSDLGYYPPPGTKIILYTEEDFREIFNKEGIVRGFYDGSIRIAVSGKIAGPYLSVVIGHEYAHAIVSIITDNKCPIWLHEGIAVYEQGKDTTQSVEHIKEAVSEGKRITIQELQDGFAQTENMDALTLSYQGSYTAVSFMLDRWGWSGLSSLLGAIKREGHFTNALDEEFYISVPVFEEMWNEYLIDKYGSKR